MVVSRGSHQATVYLDAQVERVHHLRRGPVPIRAPGQFEALVRAPRSGRRTLVAPSPRAGRKDDRAACGNSMDEELDYSSRGTSHTHTHTLSPLIIFPPIDSSATTVSKNTSSRTTQPKRPDYTCTASTTVRGTSIHSQYRYSRRSRASGGSYLLPRLSSRPCRTSRRSRRKLVARVHGTTSRSRASSFAPPRSPRSRTRRSGRRTQRARRSFSRSSSTSRT